MIATWSGGPWDRGGALGHVVVVEPDAQACLLIGAAGHADRHPLGNEAAALAAAPRLWLGFGGRGTPFRWAIVLEEGRCVVGLRGPRRPRPARRLCRSRAASRRCRASRLPTSRPADRPDSRAACPGQTTSSRHQSEPGTVDIELASSSDTTNRMAHFGHFRRLPAATWAGKFKMMPHCLH